MSTGSNLMHRAMLAIGNMRWVKTFRNNVGLGLMIRHPNPTIREAIIKRCMKLAQSVGGDATRIQFGLMKGSGDNIGWASRIIQPEDVGTRVAVFLSAEMKDGEGRLEPDQRKWIDNVRAAGGIAGVVRSEEDMIALVECEPGTGLD